MDRQAMNSSQQATIAPFDFSHARMKLASQNKSLGFQGEQRAVDFCGRGFQETRESGCSDRADHFDSAAHKLSHGIGALPWPLAIQGLALASNGTESP